MVLTQEQQSFLDSKGHELVPDDPNERTSGRNIKGIIIPGMKKGVYIYLTSAEEAEDVSSKAIYDAEKADYIANHKYKDDRLKAYGAIGDQLDMLYWDQVNATTTFRDHVAAVKATYSKP